MLVKVDGCSGSGKSVLLYLMEGHSKVYSHVFHDLVMRINDNYLESNRLDHDLFKYLFIKRIFSSYTEIEKTFYFLMKKYYPIDFSHNVKIDFEINKNKQDIENDILNFVLNNNFNSNKLINNILNSFEKTLYSTEQTSEIIMAMGLANNTTESYEPFLKENPDSKIIIIKRSIYELVATRYGRIKYSIENKSINFFQNNFDEILNSNFLLKVNKYNREVDDLRIKYNNRILILDFESLIQEKKESLLLVCEFLGIEFEEEIQLATFFGKPINHKNVNYANVKLDNYKDILTSNQIKKIDNKISLEKSRLNFLKNNLKRISDKINRHVQNL